MNASGRIGHVVNDPALIREVNLLWQPVYPGLARQVADWCSQSPRTMLEVGCFSGGTGLELLQLFPEARLCVAGDVPELVDSFAADWPAMRDQALAARVDVRTTRLDALALPAASQDLVFCRGVFFFLDEAGTVLQEMFRVLAPGGVLVAGGGFGAPTPSEVIESLAVESREKNRQLGRVVVSVEDFESTLARAGLSDAATMSQEGGLWAVLRKQP